MRRFIQLLAVLLSAGVLVSCGGGGGGGGTSSTRSGKGAVKITIKWPTRGVSRFIPTNANSIAVSISQGTTVLQGPTVVPAPTNGATTTSVTFNNLPIAALVLNAAAYPSTDGTGVAQSKASVMVTPVAGQTITVPVALQSTVATLTVSASAPVPTAPTTATKPILAYSQSLNLVVTGKDASGNVVLLQQSPSLLTYATSNANILAIDLNPQTGAPNGEITAVTQSPVPTNPASAQITVTYTPTAPPTPNAVSTTITVYTVPDTGQKVFIADTGNNQIIETDQFLNLVAMYGTQGNGIGQFNAPWTIAVGPDNRIYVVDQGNGRITRQDDMTGTNFVSYGTIGGGTGQFLAPEAIYIDATSHIYIADTGNNRVVRMDDMSGTNWTVLTSVAGMSLKAPAGVAGDAIGRIYISDGANNRVVRVDDMTGANPLANNSGLGLNDPSQMQILPNQYIAFTDEGNNRVLVLDSLTTASPSIYIHSDPTSTAEKMICSSLGIMYDSMILPEQGVFGADGTLYVSDVNRNEIDAIYGTNEDVCLWSEELAPYPTSGSQGLTVVNHGP